MATTPEAVADAIAAAIIALTPTSLAGEPFQRYAGEKQFTKWAEDSVGHCFRWFDLRYTLPDSTPDHVNASSGRWRIPFTLDVAYPRVHFKALTPPRRAILRVRHEDFVEIWPVLRDAQLATCVALDAQPEASPDEDADPVIFMRVTVPYEMRIDV